MADLSKILVRDCELSVRTTNMIGGDTPLSWIEGMSDDALRIAGHTRKSIKELRELIEDATFWPEATPKVPRPVAAIENLRTAQRQLDADGTEVGVSRQALDEVLDWLS